MKEKVSFEIKGTPLIKFQSASRIDDLRKGHLYAKTLGYYRDLEQETGDSDIGDEFEAMIHIHEGSITFPDTGEVIDLDDDIGDISDIIAVVSAKQALTALVQKHE